MNAAQGCAHALDFVRQCDPNNALILARGPMGSGKTTFAKMLFSSFGLSPDLIQSPTFLHLNEYRLSQGFIGLHIDCDRFEVAQDLEQLGLEHYEGQRLLIYVEWPQLFVEFLKGHNRLSSILNLSQKALNLNFASDFSISL